MSLQITPSSVNFGNVVVGDVGNYVIQIKNTGSYSITINSWNITAPFSQIVTVDPPYNTPVPGATITPGGSILVKLVFQPTAVGAANQNVSLVSDADDSPNVLILSGTGDSAGANLIQLTPAPMNFGEVKTGETSADINLLITNLGALDATFTSVTFNHPTVFNSDGAVAVPFTVPAAGNTNIPIKFTPPTNGLFDYTDAITLEGTFSDATPIALSYEIIGWGVPVISYLNLIGQDKRAILGLNAPASINPRYFGMFNPTDLNSEEVGVFSRAYDFGDPVNEKSIMRVLLYYEDLGEATITIYAISSRQNVNKTITIGTAGADGKVKRAIADLVISDDLITLTVQRQAHQGPVSIVQLIPYLEPRGEVVENV